MGDGIFDHYVMKKFSILSHQKMQIQMPKICKLYYKTKWWKQNVAEASLHIKKFFVKYDPEKKLSSKINFSGKWKT